jgi:predicted transcriptional regulator of viral defense system
MSTKIQELTGFMREKGGVASYSEITGAGYDKSVIRAGIKAGKIMKMESALYNLPDEITLSMPDYTIVAMKVPNGVICLLSALYFHEATLEIPRVMDVAVKKGNFDIKISHPPVKFYRFSEASWAAGITEYEIDGRKVKIYNLAKTVADTFKFRNRIGMDVAREALKTAVIEKKVNPLDILKYARICRVANIVKPLLETIILLR